VQSLVSQGVEFNDIWLANDNPYEAENRGQYKNMQLNYEKMRRTVLEKGYEFVWIVESDTLPPEDALAKLMEVDAPVVSGLYALRHGIPSPNLYRASHTPEVGNGMSWDEIKARWGETVAISGGCMGCVLVHRSALEGFSMVDPSNPIAPDGPFMKHCHSKGFKQMARLDVVCGHIKPNGDTLWPDREQGYRLERLN
jgi:hypothetical protein